VLLGLLDLPGLVIRPSVDTELLHSVEPLVSVVMPARNEGKRVGRAVRSAVVHRSCRFPLEVVVVDDASDDGSCEELAKLAEDTDDVHIKVRRLPHWSGIPFARNRGAEEASGKILFIADANVIFGRHWDLSIWRYIRGGRLLAATIFDLASPFRGHGCWLLLPSMGVTWLRNFSERPSPVPISPCTGTVIYRALFHSLGGYDEMLPLYGAAESEFSVRAWLRGCEILNVPGLQLAHRFRPAPEHRAWLASLEETMVPNYLRFACCYLPRTLLQATVAHYEQRSPGKVTRWLDRIEADGVWARRAELQSTSQHDFTWLVRKFGLNREFLSS
jgi:glycosyltransferase involved in cell wall biosynthesis